MDRFLYHLLDGLCAGGILALIALGYTLVFGIVRLINFAHGEFCMVGAYAGFLSWEAWFSGLPTAAALPAALAVSALAGGAVAALTERVAYRPIRRAGRLAPLLTAIGVSLLLQNLAAFVRRGNPLSWPTEPAGTPGEWFQRAVELGADPATGLVYRIEWARFGCLGLALLLAGLLHALVRCTRFGASMRAVSEDLDAAALCGIDADRVVGRTFWIGGALAGATGTLLALSSGLRPTMGFLPGLNAFIAAVVGGIGSIPGAVLGGLLLGVLQSLVLWAGVPSEWRHLVAFVLLLLTLTVRPQGLLGVPAREKA